MRFLGLALISAALLVPALIFPSLAATRDPVALFSQYLGSAALIAMAMSQVIATRMPGVETVFGGLDRSYVLHKWLGIGAMAAVLLHDTIDAEMRGRGRDSALNQLAETMGEISLYGLLILVVITVATFIPYHLWKWTHRFMGAFFALSAFHFVFIMKPFSMADPLGLYVGGACAVGLLAYGYTLLPERLRRWHPFEVSEGETDRRGDRDHADAKPPADPPSPRAIRFCAIRGAGTP